MKEILTTLIGLGCVLFIWWLLMSRLFRKMGAVMRRFPPAR